MVYVTLLISLISLLLCSCHSRRETECQAVANELHTRPIVTIVPVIDASRAPLNWSLSEELTDQLFKKCADRDKFYLSSPQKVDEQLQKGGGEAHPFSLDLSWIRSTFDDTEFVVFVELLEHAEQIREDDSADLNLTVRLRAVDLRGTRSHIVLQEMIHATHHIPRQFTKEHFHQVPWHHPAFEISPVGLAHHDLVKTVSSRLEDYILRHKKEQVY